MKRALLKTLVVFGLGMLFTVTMLAAFIVVYKVMPPPNPVNIEKLPVVVMSPDGTGKGFKARVVLGDELDEYLDAVSDHSFLVPDGTLDQVNRQVKDQHEYPGDGLPDYAKVEMLRNVDGSQYLKVTAWLGDRMRYVGWYEATREGFTPKKFLYDNIPTRVMYAMGAGILVNLALWGIGIGIYGCAKRSAPSIADG